MGMTQLGNRYVHIAAAVLLAFMASVFAGCEKKTDTAEKGTVENPWVIGMSQCNLENEPWRVRMNLDISAAAGGHKNIKVIFKDAGNDAANQQEQMLRFIEDGVDLIVVSPKDSNSLKGPIDEAMRRNIPVIVLDRDVEGKNYTCFIGGNNYLIGQAAGQYIAEVLNGKGNVVEIMGDLTSEPGKQRHDGFMDGLGKDAGMYKADKKGDGKINVVFAKNCEWIEGNVAKPMAEALAEFEEIDLVYAHNDPMAHGAWLAAKEEGKGREKTIKFVGIDALPSLGLKYLDEGILTATFYYPTLGPETIDTALKILNGEKVAKRILLPTKLYTKENMAGGGLHIGHVMESDK